MTSDSITNIDKEEQDILVEEDDDTWESEIIDNFKSSACNLNSLRCDNDESDIAELTDERRETAGCENYTQVMKNLIEIKQFSLKHDADYLPLVMEMITRTEKKIIYKLSDNIQTILDSFKKK